MRNNKLKTCVIELSPGFKKAISKAKSQIKQLDVRQKIGLFFQTLYLNSDIFLFRKELKYSMV